MEPAGASIQWMKIVMSPFTLLVIFWWQKLI